MTISEKYQLIRPQISDGDLILFHGTGIIAKIIEWGDDSYFSHIGVVVEKHGALFIVDANSDGVQADRLSCRIDSYKDDADFAIIKPLCNKKDIIKEMKSLLKKSDNKWIRYDFENGIKELLNRKFNWNLKISLRDEHAICSSNDAQYATNLEIVTIEFQKLRISFPQDYIRYLNKDKVKIIDKVK